MWGILLVYWVYIECPRRIEMELTLRGYGIRVKVLREQVEEKTSRIVKQVYRRRSSEPRLDHQKEHLEASGSRYVGPIR
jgi:hypothetical protein